MMVSIHDVDRIEQLYATGQKVKAISECRVLALVTRYKTWYWWLRSGYTGHREFKFEVQLKQ